MRLGSIAAAVIVALLSGCAAHGATASNTASRTSSAAAPQTCQERVIQASPDLTTDQVNAACGTPAASESCVYGSTDAVVQATGSVCGTLLQGLAHTGTTWNSVGGFPATDNLVMCSLVSGDSTMKVFDLTQAGQPDSGVANAVCSGEEQNGWTLASS